MIYLSGWDTFNFVANKAIKLAYINLLWIFFSVIGLVIFTLFPATIAMFTVINKLINIEENEDIKVLPIFWQSFRSEFFKANGYGIFFVVIGCFLYIDFIFLKLHNEQLQILFPLLFLFILVFCVTLLFFFPVYVHYKLGYFQYLKQSFFIAMTSPVETIFLVLSGGLIYVVGRMLPGTIPLFVGSVFAYASIVISKRSFVRVKERQKKMNISKI